MVGSGIRKKPIPDPGSRGQKGTGSRIPDPDPQHCLKITEATSAFFATVAKPVLLFENFSRQQHGHRPLVLVRVSTGRGKEMYYPTSTHI
jgi:hypothetical protein